MTAWLSLTGEPRTKMVEVDDNDAYDMIEVRIYLRHRVGIGDLGYVVQQAGMNYQLPYQSHYSQAIDPRGADNIIVKLVGHKATEMIGLLLEHRREIGHKHKKKMVVDG